MKKAVVALSGAALVFLVGCGDAQPAAEGVDATASVERCTDRSEPTPANVTVWFVSELQQALNPDIRGGVENPFGCAYRRLCSEVRDRVSEAEFRRTAGQAVSPVLSAHSWYGVRDPNHVYRPGVEPVFADAPTDDTHTWMDGVFSWLDPYSVPAGTPGRWPVPRPDEPWRAHLVSEGGEWHVCSFEQQHPG